MTPGQKHLFKSSSPQDNTPKEEMESLSPVESSLRDVLEGSIVYEPTDGPGLETFLPHGHTNLFKSGKSDRNNLSWETANGPVQPML